MNYISIDLDWPTRLQIVKTWYRVAKYGGPFGRVSSSGHGVHIRNRQVLPKHVPVARAERLRCGDDYRRVYQDTLNTAERNQLLFDTKGGARAGTWVTDIDRLIELYESAVSVTPERQRAEKRLTSGD